jgi:hypothetical protein
VGSHGVKDKEGRRDRDVPRLPSLFNPFASIERNRSLSGRNRIGRVGTTCCPSCPMALKGKPETG